jgi:hypothetical protein
MDDDGELDPELAEALRMSMQQDDGGEVAVPSSSPAGDVRICWPRMWSAERLECFPWGSC